MSKIQILIVSFATVILITLIVFFIYLVYIIPPENNSPDLVYQKTSITDNYSQNNQFNKNQEEQETTGFRKCIDSDGGFKPYELGYGSYKNSHENSTEDTCLGDKKIMEVICDKNNNIYNGRIYFCPYGCEDGVCKKCDAENTCVSTDRLQCFEFTNSAECLSSPYCDWVKESDLIKGFCFALNK